jgi:uncharacterized protein YuzE
LRFELDTEVNALYIYLRDIPAGGVAKTVEIQEGVNLDLDDQGRTLGIEFVDLEDFRRFLEDRGGVVDIPERAEDIPGLSIV